MYIYIKYLTKIKINNIQLKELYKQCKFKKKY